MGQKRNSEAATAGSSPEDACPVCFGRDWRLFANAFDRLLNRPGQVWQIRRCQGCGFGWTAPPLDVEEIAGHYPNTYHGDTSRTIEEFLSGRLQKSRSWRQELEKVELVERDVQSGRILDVGCGDGKFLWALDRGRWERFGVEFSQGTVDLVRGRIQDLNLMAGDIFEERLGEGTFDVVTFWHVLEHLPFPERVLERTRDLLKPEGRVFISSPNLDSLQARLFGRFWYAFDDVPRHLHHFTPRALEILLERAGFRVDGHLFFSKIINFHCLKHSLVNWSEDSWNSRLPYYLLKPLLFVFPPAEYLSGRYGIMTSVGRKERG